MVESPKMRKEDYISVENLPSKSREWLKDIEIYSGSRNRFDFSSANSALLVIDMQRYFLDEKSHAFIPASKAIMGNVQALITAFRKIKMPVVFTRHSYSRNEEPGIMGRWWGDNIMESSPLSEISSYLNPMKGDKIVRKTRYSAFQKTGLHEFLKGKDIERVVITGVMTHLCCETTAREAFMKDYEVYFSVDATATQNEELHVSSLRTLSHGFCIPVLTDEIIAQLEGN
jgi:isochorismate hydrolase